MFPVVEKYYTCEHNKKKMEMLTKILKQEMEIFVKVGVDFEPWGEKPV